MNGSRRMALDWPFVLLLGAVLVAGVPGSVLAHDGMGPWIEVVDGELRPGEQFAVFGDDLDPDDLVVLELAAGAELYSLGTVTTDEEGHFLAEVIVPPGLPDGDAYVQVTTNSGWAASMWVYVGDDPAAAGRDGGAARAAESRPASPIWADPSVIALGVFVGGAALAAVHLLRNPRPRPRRA